MEIDPTANGTINPWSYTVGYDQGGDVGTNNPGSPQTQATYPAQDGSNTSADAYSAGLAVDHSDTYNGNSDPMIQQDKAEVDWAQTFNPVNIVLGQGKIYKGQSNPLIQDVKDQSTKIAKKAEDTAKDMADAIKKPVGDLLSEIKWGFVIVMVFIGMIIWQMAKQTKITRVV